MPQGTKSKMASWMRLNIPVFLKPSTEFQEAKLTLRFG
jgi:hypothetical protein